MEFNTVLLQIVPVLEGAKIPYMVSGGQALLFHGLEPFNSDVDISLGVGVVRRTLIQKLLAKMQLKIMVRSPANFVRQTHVLPTINEVTGTRVDFIFADSEFEKEAVHRALKLNIKGQAVNFMTLEDMLIHKVVSGEESDLEHARALLAKKPKIKVRYIQQTLKEFSEMLDKAFIPVFENLRKKRK
ncbi:MAG: hypothetical protein EPO24_11400 [Bacteroidetes bacterium]|nr:MAG: hypothetical protein EPO24_11400 [Bacteroidota bacterium]